MKNLLVLLTMCFCLTGCNTQQSDNLPSNNYYEPYSEPCSNCHSVEQINKYRDNDIPQFYHQRFEQAKMVAFKRMHLIE